MSFSAFSPPVFQGTASLLLMGGLILLGVLVLIFVGVSVYLYWLLERSKKKVRSLTSQLAQQKSQFEVMTQSVPPSTMRKPGSPNTFEQAIEDDQLLNSDDSSENEYREENSGCQYEHQSNYSDDIRLALSRDILKNLYSLNSDNSMNV